MQFRWPVIFSDRSIVWREGVSLIAKQAVPNLRAEIDRTKNKRWIGMMMETYHNGFKIALQVAFWHKTGSYSSGGCLGWSSGRSWSGKWLIWAEFENLLTKHITKLTFNGAKKIAGGTTNFWASVLECGNTFQVIRTPSTFSWLCRYSSQVAILAGLNGNLKKTETGKWNWMRLAENTDKIRALE